MLFPLSLISAAHFGMLVLLVLGFGFVIFWHELGHFLAAKFVGIKVEQFAVGFGQAVVSWRKGIGFRVGNTQKDYRDRVEKHLMAVEKSELQFKEKLEFSDAQVSAAADELGLGETEYRLNWIPLGGYVKMLGQDDLKPLSQADDPRAYNRKSVRARMLVISAGVVMNIILAAIGFMVLFLIGFHVPRAWAGNVVPNSPAQKAGLKVGDHINYFDGKWEADFTKIMLDTALAKEGTPVRMIVARPVNRDDPKSDYYEVDLTVTPERAVADQKFLAIGFTPPRTLQGEKKEDAEGSEEGIDDQHFANDMLLIKAGDVITAVNGQPVLTNDYARFYDIVQSSHGQKVNLTIKDAEGNERQGSFQPHFEQPFTGEFNLAGMLPRVAIMTLTDKSPVVGKILPMDVIESLHDADPWPHPSHELFMKRMSEDSKSGHSIDFEILRDGKNISVDDVKATARLGEGRYGLGVGPALDEEHTVVADVMPGSAAEQAGLKGGDTVTAINGKPVTTWYDVQQILAAATMDADGKNATVKITYTRPQLDKPVDADLKLSAEQVENIKGIRYGSWLSLVDLTSPPRQTSNPIVAARWGIIETRDFILQFYLTLRRMADGSISPSNMMGPVGIFAGGKAFAYRGTDWLLWFLAMISANLAVVNFLPIPVVDGGQFMFLIFEKIKGKPLSPKAMAIAQYAGLAFLAAVVLFVTYHDIFRMIG